MATPVYTGDEPARLTHFIEGAARVRIDDAEVVVFDSQGDVLIRALARRVGSGNAIDRIPIELEVGGASYGTYNPLTARELGRLPAALAYLRGDAGRLPE